MIETCLSPSTLCLIEDATADNLSGLLSRFLTPQIARIIVDVVGFVVIVQSVTHDQKFKTVSATVAMS